MTPNVEEHHPLCYTNTKCLQIEDEQPCGQSCSETPTSYVQIGKGSQFSSEPIYSSPKRNKPSFTDFDMTKKFQKQHSCESCNCRFEAEKELPMPTCCQADAQDKIYTNYDASMWKNLSSENTVDHMITPAEIQLNISWMVRSTKCEMIMCPFCNRSFISF